MRKSTDNRRHSVREARADTRMRARGPALRIVLICTCAFATGCSITHPVYPSSWPEQVKVESGACPDIDGNYQNASDEFTYDGFTPRVVSLAHKLNGAITTSPHVADDRLGRTHHNAAADVYRTIRLQLVADKLHVEASGADGSTRAFDLPTRLPCRDSMLILEGKTDVVFYLILNAVTQYTLALGRAEDGSLLVLDSNKGAGTYGVLPVAGSAAYWMRYRPVAPVAAQPSGVTP